MLWESWDALADGDRSELNWSAWQQRLTSASFEPSPQVPDGSGKLPKRQISVPELWNTFHKCSQ